MLMKQMALFLSGLRAKLAANFKPFENQAPDQAAEWEDLTTVADSFSF